MFSLETVKGRYISSTLDLSQLNSSGVVSDSYFTNHNNLSKIIVKLKSTEGNQEILVTFALPESYDGSAALQSSVYVNADAHDSFELAWLLLVDKQDGNFTVKASDLQTSSPSSVAEFSVVFTSTEIDPTIPNGNGALPGFALVTPGTYLGVTVDSLGRVVAGNNPTTLVGYGITDAVQKGSSEALGSVVAVECRPLLVGDASDNYANAFIPPSNFDAATVSSKRLVLNAGANPAEVGDIDASFGGIVVKGYRDHFLLYDVANGAWNTSDNLNLSCETGIKIDNKTALDEQKVKIGNRTKGGKLYLGSGEHDSWRLGTNEQGDLVVEYRKLDGQWLEKGKFQLSAEDKQNTEVNMYQEKRGELAKKPSLVAGTEAYNFWPMYQSENGELSVKLNLNTDDAVAMGRIMKRSINFNGSIPGPVLKIKPGDQLFVEFENNMEDLGEIEPWNDRAQQEHEMLHMHLDDRAYPSNAEPMPLDQATIWMSHPMMRGQTNLHTHGFHVRPDGFGDNVMRTVKPGAKLRYYYDIPANHFGGLMWFHPHGHGGSMNSLSRGSAGAILIEGPYQDRLNAAGIEREFMILQRMQWGDNLNGHDELNWVDYVSNLQLDMYDADAEPQADGQKVTAVTPLDLSPFYKDNVDPKCICTCAALEGNAPHVHGNFSMANPNCTPVDVRWVPTINGQKQPKYSLKINETEGQVEKRIFSALNATGITFYRVAVKDHDIVIVGRDGIPCVPSEAMSDVSVDPDFVRNPAGQRLNYFIINPGQRFEFFVIPKAGVTPAVDSEFEIFMLPITETEDFAGGLDAPVKMGSIKYDGGLLPVESIVELASILPNRTTDGAAVPQEDKRLLSYITSVEELQNLLGETPIIAAVGGASFDPATGTIVMPNDAPHHLEVGARIKIGPVDYQITALDADAATFVIGVKQEGDVLPTETEIAFEYDLYKKTVINNNNTGNVDQEIVEILTDHYFYRGIALPVPALVEKIARVRKMSFAIHGRGIAGMGAHSTYMNESAYNDFNRFVAYLGTNEEFQMENKSDVIHLFHIHINEYQVVGYKDGIFGANVDPSLAAKYDFASEIDVPFEGYEDTTTVPAGILQEDPANQVVADEANLGERGEIRMRTTFKDFTGLFLMHCHLLDDQDMGMMQAMEVVGPDYVQAPYVGHSHTTV